LKIPAGKILKAVKRKSNKFSSTDSPNLPTGLYIYNVVILGSFFASLQHKSPVLRGEQFTDYT